MYTVIHDAVVAACDMLDGVKDAVISAKCPVDSFMPSLACTATKTSNCLTAPQQDNLRAIYADQYMGSTLLHEAPLPGSETAWT
ncbi:tannase/feruloyl esterase family alpha/beta hydrolase, partial [Escherichia coli]|uniref:tannase/feruloyl esterase family alpha/beta hydrolase n=1 Tax=Escherichia coli TaxID=562 RepID=UPI0021196F47